MQKRNPDMAFFEKLRRAFGLDDSVDYDDEIEGIDATVTPLKQRRQEQAAEAAARAALPESEADPAGNTPDAEQPDTTPLPQAQAENAGDITSAAAPVPAIDLLSGDDNHTVPAGIFRTVVEIFNKSLPDFLSSTVDTARQEQYLYDALEKGMKGYLDSLQAQAQRQYAEQRQSDMLRMEAELHQLREGMRQREEEASDTKKLQLSAERQKRALTERVHDLEKQIASLEAEAEQYDLENKSLVNKLRLASLQEKSMETVRADEEERNAELETLRAENRQLTDAIEQLKLKETLGQTMVNDLQARASDALKALADKEQIFAENTAELNRRMQESEAELTSMRLDMEAANQRAATAEQATARATATAEELRIKLEEYLADRQEAQALAATLQSQLDKSREKLSVITEIQQQLEKLEEASLKSDAIIRRHKDELMEKDELLKNKDADLRDKNMILAQKDALIKRLEDQTDALRRQLEDAAYDKSQSESALRAEISRLKNLPTATATTTTAPDAALNGADTPADANADEKTGAAGAIDYMLDDLPIIEKTETTGKKVETSSVSEKKAKVLNEPASEAVVVKPARTRRKTRNAAPAVSEPETAPAADGTDSIIDDLDATDWLVATPAPKKRAGRRADTPENDDFGYHEPPRANHPDNPAQMSLF